MQRQLSTYWNIIFIEINLHNVLLNCRLAEKAAKKAAEKAAKEAAEAEEAR